MVGLRCCIQIQVEINTPVIKKKKYIYKPWLKGGDSDGDTRGVGGFVCQFGMTFAVVVAMPAMPLSSKFYYLYKRPT